MLYVEPTESIGRVGLFSSVLNVQSGMLETWFLVNIVWWYQAMNANGANLFKSVATY